MRLLLVELNRFRLRRAIVLMVLAAALLTALMAAATLWDTRPLSEADVARAQAQVDRETSSPGTQRELLRCAKNPERYGGPGTTAEQCEEMILPRLEWYLDRPQLALDRVSDDAGLGALLLVAGIMVIVGTTFAGADWATGSMSNQLIFETRRSRVWLAKGGAVLVGTLVATAVIMTAFWAAIFLAAEVRGISTGATVQEEVRGIVARGVLLAGLGATGSARRERSRSPCCCGTPSARWPSSSPTRSAGRRSSTRCRSRASAGGASGTTSSPG
ncbi:MAG: hypothetical protein ACXWXO_14735 [Nocardioides sp.]